MKSVKRLLPICLLAAGLLAGPLGLLLAQEMKDIAWKYGLNFQVRKAGQEKFDGALKYGAEVFHDRDINKLVYIDQTGALGVAPGDKVKDVTDVKAPRLYHGLELRVRPVGETEWKNAKKFGAEVFRDPNAENLVYLSETGSMTTLSGEGISAPEKIKDPVWFHGLELKVRKAGEKEFTEKTKKVSLEVYKDENTGQLVYVTDSGHIAVVPARDATKPSEVKGPTWYHAFEVRVRKADEKEFTKDTRAYGFEVYKDENTNNLIYICESGALSVVPSGGATKPATSKEPKWLFGRSFRVRTAEMDDFNDKTPRHGAEIYLDENVGNRFYVTDSGSISVFAGK
jgi:hypothetical protein